MTILINPSLGATQKLYPAYKGGASAYYVDLTIDRAQVGADVVDFPLCIQGNEMPAGFWSHVGDGTDILVTDVRSGRVLRKEIELLDTTGGSEKLAIHSKVPFIGTGYDQVLRIYYGGAATQAETDWAVWRSEYVFVSHMADYNLGTQIKDSTSNRNHGTKGAGAAAPTEVAGAVGKAQQFVAASGQSITFAGTPSLQPAEFTVTFVTKLADLYGYQTFVKLGDWYVWTYSTTGQLQFTSGVHDIDTDAKDALIAGTTYVVAATFRPSGLCTVSINGAVKKSANSTGDMTHVADWYKLGQWHQSTTRFLNGVNSEFRLSSVAWSAEWIALEHKTLLDPTTLYGISAEVAL